MIETGYLGVESGNKVPDKFARNGLTADKAEAVNALSLSFGTPGVDIVIMSTL